MQRSLLSVQAKAKRMVVEMTGQGQMQKMPVLILGMMTKMTVGQMKSWTMSLRREQRQQRSGAGPTATPPPATAKGREKRGLTVQRQAITRPPPSRAHLPRSWQPEVPRRASSRYALRAQYFNLMAREIVLVKLLLFCLIRSSHLYYCPSRAASGLQVQHVKSCRRVRL